MKYKAVSHLQDIKGGIVTPDTIVEDKDLGGKEVIDRYLELGAIVEPTTDELAADMAEPAIGGSIVGATEKQVEKQADDAADKSAQKQADAKK